MFQQRKRKRRRMFRHIPHANQRLQTMRIMQRRIFSSHQQFYGQRLYPKQHQLFGRIIFAGKFNVLRPVPRIGQLLPGCIRQCRFGRCPRNKRLPHQLYREHHRWQVGPGPMPNFCRHRKLCPDRKWRCFGLPRRKLLWIFPPCKLWANRGMHCMSNKLYCGFNW
jgi:hypothetical protein